MTPADARAVIRALRVGSAALEHADLLGVGQEAMRGRLQRELDRLGAGDEVNPVLVEGDWGSGKSHVLALARALARSSGMPTTSVTFNARSAPLSHPNRIYPVLAQSINGPTGERGVRSLVRGALADPDARTKLESFVGARDDAFGAALADLLRARSAGDLLLLGRTYAWSILLGADLTMRDDQGRKRAGVGRLRALAELCSILGHGLVVLGDEVESLGQLWNSISRAGAYNALGSLFDIPGILWVLGAAGNFQRLISHDLEQGLADSWRMKEGGRSFFARWRAGRFIRLRPAVLGREAADDLGDIVRDLYGLGYGVTRPRTERELQATIAAWSDDPARNPRRLARGLVETLDRARPLPEVTRMGEFKD